MHTSGVWSPSFVCVYQDPKEEKGKELIMQIYAYKNAVSEPTTAVMYHSPFYTVVRASIKVSNGSRRPHEAHAEGVSVRCWKDAEDNPAQGEEIAKGRALKALSLKLDGKLKRDHIKRATDLLMNG